MLHPPMPPPQGRRQPRRRLLAGPVAVALALGALGGLGPAWAVPSAGTAPVERVDEGAARLFRAEGVPEGAFLLQDLHSGSRWVVGARLAGQGFLPCSTFKVPNSLIGLQEGRIDPAVKRPWDGVRRDFAGWNQDTDLAHSLEHSVVWYHRAVAREVGLPAMKRHLAAFAFGNGNFAHGVDGFWLEGPFRVTPRNQLAFHAKLRAHALPVAEAHQALVERLIVRAKTADVTWRGKTGLGRQDGRALGWLAGSLDRADGRSWAYVLLVLDRSDRMMSLIPKRPRLVKAFLRHFGALKPTELPEEATR